MATDTKNESAPPEASPTIAAGDDGKRHPGSYKQETKRLARQAAILIVFLIALAGLGVLLRGAFHANQKVYAEAAGHKIYKKDIQALVGNNKKISDHDAAKALADRYLTQTLASEQHISVSDSEVAQQWGQAVVNQKNTNKYAYQIALNNLYFNKLVTNSYGIYKGKVLVANFSRYIPYHSTALPALKKANPNIGNQQLIAQDKQYAKSFITKLYNEIKSGQITFDQAIEMEHNDPQVGTAAYPALSHSGNFDNSLMSDNRINTPSVRPKIRAMRVDELSKPFTGLMSTSPTGKSTAESYYLVVKLDSKSGGNSTATNPSQYLDNAKKRLGYKVNV